MDRIILCGIALVGLCGCASTFVGSWTAENPPADTRSLTLMMNADGTFSAVTEGDEPHRFAGTWTKDTSGKASLRQHEGYTATATRLGKERLIITPDGVETTLQFKRLK